MDAKITSEVLDAYVRCPYKAYLLLSGRRDEHAPYAVLREARQNALRNEVAIRLRAKLGDDIREGLAVTSSTLAEGVAVLLNPILARQQFELVLDGLKRVSGESALGAFHYVPMLITAEPRVQSEHRLLIEMLALLLAPYKQIMPAIGIIWLGGDRGAVTIRISPNVLKAKSALAVLQRLASSQAPPRLILNDHPCVLRYLRHFAERD